MTGMTALPRTRMTVDEYLAWAEGQPGRYELLDGVVFAMSPGRRRPRRKKSSRSAALLSGIRARGVHCYALPDGMTVRIDKTTAYEPDALVYCGTKLTPSATFPPSWRIISACPALRITSSGIRKDRRDSPCAQQRRDHSHAHRHGGERQARPSRHYLAMTDIYPP